MFFLHDLIASLTIGKKHRTDLFFLDKIIFSRFDCFCLALDGKNGTILSFTIGYSKRKSALLVPMFFLINMCKESGTSSYGLKYC